jgi:hypothetical protein
VSRSAAAVAPKRAVARTQALRKWSGNDDVLPLLTLRLLIENDEERRARSAATLVRQTNLVVAPWALLRKDVRTAPESDPPLQSCARPPMTNGDAR